MLSASLLIIKAANITKEIGSFYSQESFLWKGRKLFGESSFLLTLSSYHCI